MPYGKSKSDPGKQFEVPTQSLAETRSQSDFTALPEPESARDYDEEASFEGDPNRPEDEGEELERRRTGFYLGTHLGAAYMRVSPYDDAFPAFSGFGFSFDLLIGGSPSRDFAVGGMIGGATAPKPRYDEPDAPRRPNRHNGSG
jgi:hypothetical protein